MRTTVQLEKSTKQDLVSVKAHLEQLTGEPKSFNDAIKWLLRKNSTLQHYNKKKIANELVGSLKDLQISLLDLTEIRRMKDSRVADF